MWVWELLLVQGSSVGGKCNSQRRTMPIHSEAFVTRMREMGPSLYIGAKKNFQLHQQARPGRPETAPRCSLFVLCMCFSPAARIEGLWHMRSRRLAQGNHTCENAEFVGPMCRRRFWLKLGITFPGVCRWGGGAHEGCER